MRAVPNSLFIIALVFAGAGPAALAQAPAVAPGGVLNAASSDTTGQPAAPGSLLSIYGSNLVFATASALSIPLPSELSGVSVTVNGMAAPILSTYHGPDYDQLNVQLPWEVAAVLPPTTVGTARIIVTRNGVQSAAANIPVAPAGPGIFTFQTGPGQAVAYSNADGAIAAPVTAALPFPRHPAKIGDPNTLVILATGLGPVDIAVKSGDIPSPAVLTRTVIIPTVLIGGVQAQVVFSGLIGFVGVYQINVIIAPGTPTGDAVPLQILINGITTRNDATIAVMQ